MSSTPQYDAEEYERWAAEHGHAPALGRPGVRPSRMLALGLALVSFNLFIGGIDILFNPAGWVLAAVALHRAAHRHRLLRVAAWASAVGVLLSSVVVLAGRGRGAPPASGRALPFLEGLVPVVVTVAVCTALIVLVGDRDPGATRQANLIRWLQPGLVAAMLAVLGAVSSPGYAFNDVGSAGGGVATVVMALLVANRAVHVWFLILLMTRGAPLDGAPAQDPLPDGTGTPAAQP